MFADLSHKLGDKISATKFRFQFTARVKFAHCHDTLVHDDGGVVWFDGEIDAG